MSELFCKEETNPLVGSSELFAMRRYLEGFGKRLLDESRLVKVASDLGFFSKPFRISFRTADFIIKLYSPIRNRQLADFVMKNHDEYINELRSAGIKVPATLIFSRKVGKKVQLVIVQKAFRDDELLRNLIINATIDELCYLCNYIFTDVVRFWNYLSDRKNLGFHPTLRNYSLHNNELYYFDTFPPMLMNQENLNRLIIKWSPFGGWIRNVLPARLLNRVSDEYYNLDKMFAGIVGSCCRLRPDDSEPILDFSRNFVKNSDLLAGEQKEKISGSIYKPPRLSRTWLFIRRISGSKGNPNIPSSHSKLA